MPEVDAIMLGGASAVDEDELEEGWVVVGDAILRAVDEGGKGEGATSADSLGWLNGLKQPSGDGALCNNITA